MPDTPSSSYSFTHHTHWKMKAHAQFPTGETKLTTLSKAIKQSSSQSTPTTSLHRRSKVLSSEEGANQVSINRPAEASSAAELAQRWKTSTLESQPRPASLINSGNGHGSRAQIISVQATGGWVQTSVRRGAYATVLWVCVGYFSITVTKYLTSSLKGVVCFGSWLHRIQLKVACVHILGQTSWQQELAAHLRA